MLIRRLPVPRGTLAVGVGLVVNGLAAYAFLAVAGRRLDAHDYGVVSALWFSVFLIGPGFFQPLEQEVSRIISSRNTRGVGAGPVLRQAAIIGAGLVAVLVAVAVGAGSFISGELFDGEWVMLVGLVLALVGYACAHLVRGLLAGNHRFGPYARFFAGEGVFRLLLVLVFAVFGYSTLGAYGIAVGAAPFLAAGLALAGEQRLAGPGPDAHFADLGRAMGALLAASVFTAFLVNVGPLAVKLFAEEGSALTGTFANGLLVARIPQFFFQAVQAALLPQLSESIGLGRYDEFRQALGRLLVGLVVFGVLATTAMAILGPFAVRTMFGPEYVLDRADMALLSVSTSLLMCTLTLAQGLIAVSKQTRLALCWFVGVIAFWPALLVSEDIFRRVELALIIAIALTAGLMAVSLYRHLATREVEPAIALAD